MNRIKTLLMITPFVLLYGCGGGDGFVASSLVADEPMSTDEPLILDEPVDTPADTSEPFIPDEPDAEPDDVSPPVILPEPEPAMVEGPIVIVETPSPNITPLFNSTPDITESAGESPEIITPPTIEEYNLGIAVVRNTTRKMGFNLLTTVNQTLFTSSNSGDVVEQCATDARNVSVYVAQTELLCDPYLSHDFGDFISASFNRTDECVETLTTEFDTRNCSWAAIEYLYFGRFQLLMTNDTYNTFFYIADLYPESEPSVACYYDIYIDAYAESEYCADVLMTIAAPFIAELEDL